MTNNAFSYIVDTTTHSYPTVRLAYTPTDSSKQLPVTITIAPTLGSNMFSFTYGENSLIHHEPLLLETCDFTGNFVLFPTPNRVENAEYSWGNTRVVQKKHGELRLLHGLVYDEPWEFTTPVISETSVSVTTSLTITKESRLFQSYPFPCTLSLLYTLTPDGVAISYTVRNEGETELPFGFALHPYFSRLSGDTDTYITVPAKSWMESPSDTLIPTGKLIDVSGKPYNVNTARPIGELSLDHVYTELPLNQFASIDYKTLGLRVTLNTSDDFTHIVVYTGHKDAICIENQTCSTDAINLWNRGYRKESHVLQIGPHGTHSGYISYVISHI